MTKQTLAALVGIMSCYLLCRADPGDLQPPGQEGRDPGGGSNDGRPNDSGVEANALMTLKNGRNIFRYDTFGDQAFWGDTLKLHQAISGAGRGGTGPGVSPSTALAVGLKVDEEAVPQSLRKQLRAGQVDLNDPANTVALLELNAVVGVTGFFDQQRRLTSLGIQCALCHSTVDNSFASGIGHRLDGWPNRDLNVGAIINLSPDLSAFTNALQVNEATVRQVLLSWGPGKFDAALLMDGKAFRPDGKSAATLLPAAFGLAGVNLHNLQTDPTEIFMTLRPLLHSLAYQMLANAADAEDIVQECFLRWQKAETSKVRSPKAFLTTIVTRLCLKHL